MEALEGPAALLRIMNQNITVYDILTNADTVGGPTEPTTSAPPQHFVR